ncbi:O-antigen ligase family protein [uncultured Coprobacter sp.]|uniref:O-antigen ligase family protein n=1 Tax=uncultured Coprobacter sp. TaxID=1720550 RepID=UPI00263699A8|nr:O-antigen ligase family protein [uncultured Coprobacter sp.]
MISLTKTYYVFFLFTLLFGFYFYNTFGIEIVDELLMLLLLCFSGIHILTTKEISNYRGLFLVLGILFVYLFHSLFNLKINTPKAVVTDFVIQLKPLIAFYCTYAIAPEFSVKQKKILRNICLFLSFVMLTVCLLGQLKTVFFHVSYAGINMTIIASLFYLCGKDTSKNRIFTILLLSIGLFGTRSKFYGLFVLAIFILFWFKPEMLKKIRLKYILISIIILIGIIFVSWRKINYYFVGVNIEQPDEIIETAARAALYATAPSILSDYPFLGTGLGSYATHASGEIGYSEIYSKYELDNVHGLVEGDCQFISDTFYPELVQFGIIGIILYILFWRFIIKKLYQTYRKNDSLQSLKTGLLITSFIIIESIAGSVFLQGGGICAMMLLAMIIKNTFYKSANNNIIKS